MRAMHSHPPTNRGPWSWYGGVNLRIARLLGDRSKLATWRRPFYFDRSYRGSDSLIEFDYERLPWELKCVENIWEVKNHILPWKQRWGDLRVMRSSHIESYVLLREICNRARLTRPGTSLSPLVIFAVVTRESAYRTREDSAFLTFGKDLITLRSSMDQAN